MCLWVNCVTNNYQRFNAVVRDTPHTIAPPPPNFLIALNTLVEAVPRIDIHTRPSDRNNANLDSSQRRTDFLCSSVQLRWFKYHMNLWALFLFVICGSCVAALTEYPICLATVRNVPMETDTPVAAWNSCLMVAIACALLSTILCFRLLQFLLVKIFGLTECSPLSQCPSTFHLRRIWTCLTLLDSN